MDLLVVMPARNEISKASRISYALAAPFALDLIVRTPKHLQRGLDDQDWFLREVMETGKVLYEASNRSLGPESRSRLSRPVLPIRRVKQRLRRPIGSWVAAFLANDAGWRSTR